MQIISTAPAAADAKSMRNTVTASQSYARSMQASKAFAGNGMNTEVSITGLEKGDVFKGSITNITGNNVTVSLGNGQSLTATLMDNVPLNIGNELYFQVKENDGSKIILTPLTDEKFSPENQTIERSLQSAGLQLNEKNMSVVKELMDAGMPIDRGTILKVLQQSMDVPGTSLKSIVSLIKYDIPVTPGNISQFEQYEQHAGELNSQADATRDQILSEFQALGRDDAFAGDAIKNTAGFLDVFSPGSASEAVNVPMSEVFVMSVDEVLNFQNSGTFLTDENGSPVLDGRGNPILDSVAVLDDNGRPVLGRDGAVLINEDTMNSILSSHPELTRESVTALVSKEGSGALLSLIPTQNEIQDSFAAALKDLGVQDSQLRQFLDPTKDASQFIREVQNYVLDHPEISDQQIRNFFSSKQFGVVLSTVMDRNWKMTPDDAADKDSVSSYYERVNEQTKKLMDTDFSGGFLGGSDHRQGAENMNQNLHFMQDLNSRYTFVQIPVQLSRQDVNSELYVYADRQAAMKKGKNTDVLLHLDMDNLGSTDIHVQLNGSTVTARFFLEDGRSVQIVSDNISQLEDSIGKLGFSLNHEVTKRPDKKPEIEDFAKDFLGRDVPESHEIKRYTFDMRA